MDISLLKTFLEVARTRHFGRAAERLFVTQSAVSARIKLLEDTLGVTLFSRKRNDIQLTPAGQRLQRHAETMVRGWERARQELALGEQFVETLAVGCAFDLWPLLVRDWAIRVADELPGVALQLELHANDLLSQRLLSGVLDLAFMFDPPQISELVVRQIADVPLLMVSTVSGAGARDALSRDYVLVDWGPAFALRHARHFTDMPAPVMRVGLGTVALDLLMTRGGAAYLAQPMVAPLIEQGRLFVVADAPVIERSVYGVLMPDAIERDLVERAYRLAAEQLSDDLSSRSAGFSG
jgi:DNA-binding transcriptional LysR family regulator